MDEYQTKYFWTMIIDEAEKQKFTYRTLRDTIATLTDEQLDMEVIWAGDGRGGKLSGIWVVEEDQINPSGDGMEPVSAYDDDSDFDASDEPIVCEKGTVILIED